MSDDRIPQDTLQVLLDSNAILENDHFVYISGDHGSGWIDKDAIYPQTERIEHLCRNLARLVQNRGIEMVCGLATGGLIVAEWTSHEQQAKFTREFGFATERCLAKTERNCQCSGITTSVISSVAPFW